jgi:hypothetical protein
MTGIPQVGGRAYEVCVRVGDIPLHVKTG